VTPDLAPQTDRPASPPRWAIVADLLWLTLLVAGVVVAMTGGSRWRIGEWQVSVRSPYRLLAGAAIIALARRLGAPGLSIYRAFPGWWRRTPAVRAAAGAAIGTRPAILLVGYLAVFLVGYAGGRPPYRASSNEFTNLPLRWDGGWYLGIATDGYQFIPDQPTRQQNIVFFPAYPMLIRGLSLLTGGGLSSYLTAGAIVSLGAFFFALIYLYALARDTLGEDEARYALWLLAAYPFALFFGALYTESLFLLGATGAFFHLRKRQFLAAAGWGLLVGLTRPNGCFLSIPLALLVVAPWLPRAVVGGDRWPAEDEDTDTARNLRGRLLPGLAAAAMPGIGVLLYSAFVWHLTGNPLAWAAGHAAWGRTYQGLTELATSRYYFIVRAGLYAYSSQQPLDLLNGLGVVFVLATVWPVARRLGLAYAVFILINILPPLAAGGLLSAGRLSAVLFPSFLWFAGAVPRRQRYGWIAGFMAVQALNATLFYTWRPLF
jgi:hypothetical protein